jgi:hypothetical protein
MAPYFIKFANNLTDIRREQYIQMAIGMESLRFSGKILSVFSGQ